MFENYINQISFGITALVCVFIGTIFFKGGEGWVKTLRSGYKFASKYEGFIWFLIGPVIVAVLAPILNHFIFGFLENNIANLIWILLVFIVILWIYYCKKHGYEII